MKQITSTPLDTVLTESAYWYLIVNQNTRNPRGLKLGSQKDIFCYNKYKKQHIIQDMDVNMTVRDYLLDWFPNNL